MNNPLRRSHTLVLLVLVASLMLIVKADPVQAATMPNGWQEPIPLSNPAAGWLASGCNGRYDYDAGLYHTGLDYWGAVGTSVKVVGDGTVVTNTSFGTGFARALFVRHAAPDGTQFVALYGHINSRLAAGDRVIAGDQVGTLAQLTGVDAHLHFGLIPGTTYPSSNWGRMPCSSWPGTNGFTNPMSFLNEHPQNGVSELFSVTQAVAVTPASPRMYQPVTYSFRFRNTSGDDVWIQRLVMAVRSPGGGALDITCAEQLILGVNQEWTCTLPLQQGYGQQGTYQYWADWQDWDEYWHTGDLGGKKAFVVGPPHTLTAVQPISVGPNGTITMYTPVNYSYRVKNTSGMAASIQRLVVAVRSPGGGNLDMNCPNGEGVSLAANQEWTCSVTLAQGYGQAGTYTFWADWQDYAGNWHAGQLGSTTATTLAVTPTPTLMATSALSVGPGNPVVRYQAVFWSYRVKNTSGGYASIQRFVVAVRTPDGAAMDVLCNSGAGVTLAPGQEWTCSAYNNDGYGSSGQFQFWADWLDYAGRWHHGQLSSTLTLYVN